MWASSGDEARKHADAVSGGQRSQPRREPWGVRALPYRRRDWRHWIDADHDCQDTRQEVLVEESEVPVEFADARHCKVKRGLWTCPYTGRTVTDPGELDIDHMVSLENAFRSGGWRWSTGRRRDYANDLGPDAWLPSDQAFACAYVTAWVAIKKRWTLTSTAAEATAAERVLESCGRRPR